MEMNEQRIEKMSRSDELRLGNRKELSLFWEWLVLNAAILLVESFPLPVGHATHGKQSFFLFLHF